MARPDFQTRFVPRPGDATLLDRGTGLLWRAPSRAGPVPFARAVDRELRCNWRLPSVSELMDLLCAGGGALAAGGEFPGALFWTASQSPFGPETEVRVIVCDPGPTYGVATLEKSRRAHSWLVARRLGDLD